MDMSPPLQTADGHRIKHLTMKRRGLGQRNRVRKTTRER